MIPQHTCGYVTRLAPWQAPPQIPLEYEKLPLWLLASQQRPHRMGPEHGQHGQFSCNSA